MDPGTLCLTEVRQQLRGVKALGDGALAQLPEDAWHTALSPDGNSAAVLVQHLAGNLHSRWAGLRQGYRAGMEAETPDRDRDTEFMEGERSTTELLKLWEGGWGDFLSALDHLRPEDLGAPLTIRGEPYTVLGAVLRASLHASGHVSQLVFLVKTLRRAAWQTLSIPRGGLAAFNAEMERRSR
ncbi:Protein of unknown function [Deinococcus reticulitermitis]|uniref:DinB superfamily protein n=1 Tax=Deinococcus reticulitermitis TaxID=856736 RepID=A0A1H6RT67_9DEIO|nr:DUF1572 family protein [Deinococcus reticulitermitis]SEI58929.1 Protein of unknown function [Deinococcus reticulitermitis]